MDNRAGVLTHATLLKSKFLTVAKGMQWGHSPTWRDAAPAKIVSASSKTSSQNQFHHQIISAPGKAKADTKIELPIWREIQIDSWEKLVLLFIGRGELSNRSQIAIVFDSGTHQLR